MKKFIGSAVGAASSFIFAASAFAQSPFKQQFNLDAPNQAAPLQNVQIADFPQFVVTLLFIIGIVIAVVFLIYGGIRWIVSGGDKTAVESARNHIIAAIIGLIIVVAAFFIINFVFTILTGVPFSFQNLCIPTLANGGKCPTPT